MRDDNDDQVQLFAAVWTPEGLVEAARGIRLDLSGGRVLSVEKGYASVVVAVEAPSKEQLVLVFAGDVRVTRASRPEGMRVTTFREREPTSPPLGSIDEDELQIRTFELLGPDKRHLEVSALALGVAFHPYKLHETVLVAGDWPPAPGSELAYEPAVVIELGEYAPPEPHANAFAPRFPHINVRFEDGTMLWLSADSPRVRPTS